MISLKTGVYNKNREFMVTTSPSMDILISSNLERLICKLSSQEKQKSLWNYLRKTENIHWRLQAQML